jgi:hypothetical protein
MKLPAGYPSEPGETREDEISDPSRFSRKFRESRANNAMGRPLVSPHHSGWAVGGMREVDFSISPHPLTEHGPASGQLS